MSNASRPLTCAEAEGRGLLTSDKTVAIHTFSSGSHWEGWAEHNCHSCRWFDEDTAGALCAFEAAAFLKMVTPELARLFGWIQDPKWDKPTDHRDGWKEPINCPFFMGKPPEDGGDDERPDPPIPDPTQLVLIADPTEDLAAFPSVDASAEAAV